METDTQFAPLRCKALPNTPKEPSGRAGIAQQSPQPGGESRRHDCGARPALSAGCSSHSSLSSWPYYSHRSAHAASQVREKETQ